MSFFEQFDLPAPGGRELRRFADDTVVPTTYENKGPRLDSLEVHRAEAARQGYEEGYAEGMERALADIARKSAEESQRAALALNALARAVSAAQESAQKVRSEVQEAAPKLAFELLETLLAREVSLAVNPGYEAITRVLSLDEGNDPVTVWMHPVDVASLGDLADAELGRDVNVMADPSIERGGAMVEMGRTTLDGQLSHALARVREVLLGVEDYGVVDDRVA
ncbi:MAG: FliH/SctL family protein [Acidimicrobiales bacterium]